MVERNITIFEANPKGFPDKMKKMGSRKANLYTVLWDNTGRMVLNSSEVNTKSSGKQNVLMLSKIQPALKTAKVDASKKTAIYKVYDYLQGGTDMIVQRTKFYTSKAK